MRNNLDAEIANALQTAQAFAELSDNFFAKSQPLRGAQYYRLATETITRAEQLAEWQAERC